MLTERIASDTATGETVNQLSHQYPLENDTVVVVKSCWSRRRLKAGFCLLLTIIIPAILIYLILEARIPESCSSRMSPSHTKNRTVSLNLCISHDHPGDLDEIKGILVGGNSTKAVSFLVLGDFGRDGFCCQRDVALEMERIAPAINAK